MGTRFSIAVPRDFVLKRDACSYGYIVLVPNYWDPMAHVLSRVLLLSSGPALVSVAQEGAKGSALQVKAGRGLSKVERGEVSRALSRMLRLDEPAEHIAEFHRVDPRWKKTGRGRLFRSPSFFEDVLKTVTSCNVAWPSTTIMNRRLCEVVGPGGTFPSPEKLARTRVGTLRARCSVGYRDKRIVELAKLFCTPASRRGIDAEWFEDPSTPDDAIQEKLLELPGIGPYAAANIMQLLGRYSRLPLDTESVRHGKTVLGFKGSDASVMKQVKAHFAPFGAHAFRSYWFELWAFYEKLKGPAWTWERETVGKTFTAAQMKA